MQSNLWKLYANAICTEMLFLVAIIVPFFTEFIGLSMQETLLTETVFASAMLVFEIPSGYFADRFGRKISLILGVILLFLAVLFYAFSNEFLWFCVGAGLWGTGLSFRSGADTAMLYESLLSLHREKEYKQMQGHIFFWARISTVFASIVGGFLTSLHWRLPFYVTLVPIAVFFFIALTLKETKHSLEKQETWPHLKKIFIESFVHNPRLRTFILFAGITGFFSIDFWLKQKYMTHIGIPIVYFGLTVAGLNLVSGIGSHFAVKIEKIIGPKRALIYLPIFPVIGWLSFSIFENFWMLPLLFVVPFLWGFTMPLFNDFVQNIVSSDRRATIMSVMSFMRRGAFLVFAPFLGWITDMYDIQFAFGLMAFIFLVLSGIGLFFLRKVKII